MASARSTSACQVRWPDRHASTVAIPRDLDLLAARAFPAAESEHRAGWLLRASPAAAPRRVNSALPPVPGDASRLETVARWYEVRGLVPRVMVSPEGEQ